MFNAVCKIPMQFFILLLGALVFVFYQFEQPPVFFNEVAWKAQAEQPAGGRLRALAADFTAAHAEKQQLIRAWLGARHAGQPRAAAEARAAAVAAQARSEALRTETKTVLHAGDPRTSTNDADYVFITFVLRQLPHGVIGLLVAVIFAAALSSKAAELNALGATTTVDFYRHVFKREASDAHYVAASKWFTAFWGLVALAFALFAHLVENLIQAVNILGSVFYGVVLGLFLVAFFVRRVGGTAVFWSALSAQAMVFALYFTLNISYLWYNLIGCAACVLLSLVLQAAMGARGEAATPSHALP
jgi:Na+(H+)/acetate symporter ActP